MAANKHVENSGLSGSVETKSKRFLNKDGSANVYIKNTRFQDRFSFYHHLLNLSGLKFVLYVVGFYTTINFIFACIYYTFCLPHLIGIIPGDGLHLFEEAFFFSSQTLTTVGYGRISPDGFFTNTVASLEALMGILTLAIITGVLYGRFVKPRAHIRWSTHAVIAPFRDGKGLMVRLMPIKGTRLYDVSVSVTMSMLVEENGKRFYKYFILPLQFDKLNNLVINWTIVHPINEESPLYGLSAEQMQRDDVEVFINLRAFDEMYANNVVSSTSYIYDEIVHEAKFSPMFDETPTGTRVYADKLSSLQHLK